jgi:hypothetical protein
MTRPGDTLPEIDVPSSDGTKNTNAGSAFDVLLFVKRHFLDGKPVFFNMIEYYGKVRKTYFLNMRLQLWTGSTIELKIGSILRWLIFHTCQLLDMLVGILHVAYMFAVLLVLLYGLLKIVGLDILLLKLLHL